MAPISKTEQKKLQKKQLLLDAAYERFLAQTFAKTTVEEIAKAAGVAKGTFYLYYKDKNDILDEVIQYKSGELLIAALEDARQKAPGDFVERVVLITDYIIEFFKAHETVLRLLHQDFAWGLLRGEGEAGNLIEDCMTILRTRGRSATEALGLMFMVVELVSSVCYSSIIEVRPAPIDSLKPQLFDAIRRILS